MSERLPRGLTPAALGAIALTVAAVCPLFVRKIRSADFWWHLAAGRWMVENGAIPRHDPFSFTAADQPWHYVSWPAEWLLYKVWALGGANAVINLRLLSVFAALVLIGVATRLTRARLDVVVALLVAVAVVVQPRYTLDRPMLQGAVLLGATLVVALRWWPRGGWSVVAIPALTLVWLPVHGGGIVGVACAIGCALSAALFRRERDWLLPGGVAAALALGALVGTIAGREILEHLFLLGDAGTVTHYIQEWGSPSPSIPRNRLPVILIVLGVVAGLPMLRRHPIAAGAAIVGAYLGLQHIRGLTEGVLLTLPAAALGLTWIGDRLDRAKLALAARVVPVALVALPLAAHFAWVDRPFEGQPGRGLDIRRFPSDSIEVLRDLPPGPTMNNMEIGGYLIWEQVPGGVYVDGRILAVYTAAQFDQLVVPTVTSEAAINRVADRLGIRYAVASHTAVFGRLLMRAESWVPVYHGLSTTVYARRDDLLNLQRAGFATYDLLRYDLDDGWMRQWYARVLSDPDDRAWLVNQIALGVQLSPASPVAMEVLRFLDGAFPDAAAEVEQAVARHAAERAAGAP